MILGSGSREDLSEGVTFEQGPEAGEGVSQVHHCGIVSISGRISSECKCPVVEGRLRWPGSAGCTARPRRMSTGKSFGDQIRKTARAQNKLGLGEF